jgi:hypothetical protein
MKYIEFPELARLSEALTHEGSECSVHTRIEAYSCKNINRDKKLFRSLEHAYNEEVAHSPPLPSFMALDREAEMTPFGTMDKHASRKTLYLLIATLNVAFPDHEFSDVRPAHFCKEEDGASVLTTMSQMLVSPNRMGYRAPRTYAEAADFTPSTSPSISFKSSSPSLSFRSRSPNAPTPLVAGTHPTLYRMLDDIIGLADCEVFSYVPDIAADPHAADYIDGEDEADSPGEDESSADDDDEAFAFDDYDIDELDTSRKGRSSYRDLPRARRWSDEDDEASPLSVRTRRKGGLLWSSHWFFLNRKMKRILFVSLWARTKTSTSQSWMDDESEETLDVWDKSRGKERFLGWEGAAGAGARALGLGISSHGRRSSF